MLAWTGSLYCLGRCFVFRFISLISNVLFKPCSSALFIFKRFIYAFCFFRATYIKQFCVWGNIIIQFINEIKVAVFTVDFVYIWIFRILNLLRFCTGPHFVLARVSYLPKLQFYLIVSFVYIAG